MPPGDFVFFRNVGLDDGATSLQTSTVGEPSLANNGWQIYYTGNWYATKSLDNGATWQFVSPFTTLPSAAAGFCCDQLTHYDTSRDIFVWLLQYIADANGENVFRLAIKQGASLHNNSWYWWDFAPRNLNDAWAGTWFDYPDMALSDDHLWVSFNVFNGAGQFQRSVVFKFPLDTLAAGTSLGYSWWSTTDFGSLRLTQGASDNMYFASHRSANQLRLYSWPDDSNTLSSWDVGVSTWSTGNYVSNGPDGNNWLARTDPRITGAWISEGVLGFMWTVKERGGRPNPHVRVVRINEATKALVDEPDIWSRTAAYAYPSACPNDRGDVGISIFYGGARYHPSHVVGIKDDFTTSWSLVFSRIGGDGPNDGKWGDYTQSRRHSPDGLTWIASGFTLQGGADRRNVEPRYVHFGRRRDERAVARWRDC
jgi:hypothetical protein